MAMQDPKPDLEALCSRIQDCIGRFAGRVEYGNLRSKVDDWDCDDRGPVTNVALVYETPGGSTDQINVTYCHRSRTFAVVEEAGEITLMDVDQVLLSIEPRISGIPEKRLEHLRGEIRRQVDNGSNTAGLFGHLNRIMQSEFKGGTITHLEVKEAMTYAVHYMKSKNGAPV
jgi:hypothetical protein